MKKAYIIGAGPAGMMAAISSKSNNPELEVILLEKNNELGRKMKLTGGGRCNVTANVSNDILVSNVVKNGRFLYSSFENFNSNSIINFFDSNNCKLKEEDHGRMFPITNKAEDIISAMIRVMNNLGVRIRSNQEVIDVSDEFITTNSSKYDYDYLIVATGGITLPNTGSDGFGYEIAKKFGHSITELVPAEVPLVSNDGFIASKELQGLSFKDVLVKVLNEKGKVVRKITHDLLFTHFGISGPAALRASYDVINLLKNNKEVRITVNFLTNITKDDEISEILPKRLLKYIESISKNRDEVMKKLESFEINVYTTRGFKSAFVTNGGINLKEVDPKTLKSKLNSRISFAGEVLDINAYTGGYNITSALSTGYTAGKFIITK